MEGFARHILKIALSICLRGDFQDPKSSEFLELFYELREGFPWGMARKTGCWTEEFVSMHGIYPVFFLPFSSICSTFALSSITPDAEMVDLADD
ncbi:hypothetical protein K402DRAFT_166195 [Aulographum hederae CBS 113979]|uniref:Uncharacterized protein n=1 Tax=Aulographum hederae CBS 113979 TaxID=1176131 RepID=A0A6G1GRH8_9PEZI|nr:hypothetical protein K402DRAFT_166195 [Aulographum hederae CBS 113979]